MITAHIALGSNLGHRHEHLQSALARLDALPELRITNVSAFKQTAPVDAPPDSPSFINAAAALETRLSAEDLMRALLEIERSLGRHRPAKIRHAPRPIDLDLLLYGAAIIRTPDLTVPHPRMHQRAFVLKPLAEIAPAATHPVLKKTIRELLHDLKLSHPKLFTETVS